MAHRALSVIGEVMAIAAGLSLMTTGAGMAGGGLGLSATGGGAVAGVPAVAGGAAVGGGVVAWAGINGLGSDIGQALNEANEASSSGSSSTIGENGAQFPSVTKWNRGQYRIDVENPNPGHRPGQIHVQDQANKAEKYQYNFDTKKFDGMPRSPEKKLYKMDGFKQGIQKALKALGES
ncbi:hypothetical protein [Streptomyces sp. HUAS TT7]|uniref:hypothetical protein n=1 Tax=Streptomyces sp. HUAS TT7 TaxID=3447507 RepID=UPI003F658389